MVFRRHLKTVLFRQTYPNLARFSAAGPCAIAIISSLTNIKIRPAVRRPFVYLSRRHLKEDRLTAVYF
jgi:hypothetical protein